VDQSAVKGPTPDVDSHFCGGPQEHRLISIADLHGDWDLMVGMLTYFGIIGEENGKPTPQWKAGVGMRLVLTGDIADRGHYGKKMWEFLLSLANDADGKLTIILGNHDLFLLSGIYQDMTVQDMCQYVDPGLRQMQQLCRDAAEQAKTHPHGELCQDRKPRDRQTGTYASWCCSASPEKCMEEPMKLLLSGITKAWGVNGQVGRPMRELIKKGFVRLSYVVEHGEKRRLFMHAGLDEKWKGLQANIPLDKMQENLIKLVEGNGYQQIKDNGYVPEGLIEDRNGPAWTRICNQPNCQELGSLLGQVKADSLTIGHCPQYNEQLFTTGVKMFCECGKPMYVADTLQSAGYTKDYFISEYNMAIMEYLLDGSVVAHYVNHPDASFADKIGQLSRCHKLLPKERGGM